MDIFLSRPTWVYPEMEKGLAVFISKIGDLGLNPRTLGTTDYPTSSPLDEVINIMEQCKGAVILGYPQIEIKDGKIKNREINPGLILTTEWNHIDAGLAYARILPMIVIHHRGVTRGIFDRGALNSFIFAKDFSDPTWSVSDDISGALRAWKNKVSEFSPASSGSDKKLEAINKHKNEVWSIYGVGRKIGNPKPLGSGYIESGECRIEETTEYYIRIRMLSTDQLITIPSSDFIISYDDERYRQKIEVRTV